MYAYVIVLSQEPHIPFTTVNLLAYTPLLKNQNILETIMFNMTECHN